MLENWIRSVVAVSAVCAVCCALTPEGRPKKACRIVFGIVMVIAIIAPLKELDFREYSISAEKYKLRAEQLVASASEAKENLDRRIIEEKYEAYILDKAQNCGVTPCSVTVNCAWSNEGYWYPDKLEVVLNSQEDEVKCEAVKRSAECELGIDGSRQIWRTP